MIIHQPALERGNGKVRLSARIEMAEPANDPSEPLWFEVDELLGENLAPRSDAFLAGLYDLAMARGEPIEVRGVVSPLLLEGLRSYQAILRGWHGDSISVVEISAASIEPSSVDPEGAWVASFFSGGVDSFFTLRRRLATRERVEALRVTHALMINGFDHDVDLDGNGLFRTLRKVYEPMFDGLGIDLVEVRTNLAAVRGERTPGYVGWLVAPALAFGRIRLLYVPSGLAYTELVPEGSHPMIDHLFGTESLRILHDGAEWTRAEKVREIANWPETWDRLRVCWRRSRINVDVDKGIISNCGRCGKCVRTMSELRVAGALDRYQTFAVPLSRRAVRRSKNTGVYRKRTLDQLRQAREARDWEMVFDLRWQLGLNYFIEWIENIRSWIGLSDRKRLP